jgi:L-fucose isomerase-like protein
MKIKPKICIVFTAIEGMDADQGRLEGFKDEFKKSFAPFEMANTFVDYTVANNTDASTANAFIRNNGFDLVCIAAAVWTPDTTVIRLIENIGMPVVVFTTTLSPYTLGLNGAQIVAASLKELDIEFRFIFGKLSNPKTAEKIYDFAMAAAIVKNLKSLKVGVVGGRPVIMTNLALDEFGLKKVFGATVVPLDFSCLEDFLKNVEVGRIDERIAEIKNNITDIRVEDGVLCQSVKYYLALLDMVREYKLDAIAFNCYPFPYIKAKTCLAASNLNDIGIPAACESDVYSAMLMHILESITGKSCLNSDIVFEDEPDNAIIFSHCGCGPFSCAESYNDIRLDTHFEVKSGMAVYYPLMAQGKDTTIVNLVGRENTFRLCTLNGSTLPTKLADFAGNPVTVKFKTNVVELINILGNEGFGHHWMVSSGNYKNIFGELCRLLKIRGVFIE